MPSCRTNLVGIKLYYCEGKETKEVWVDLKKVHALSWCDEEVGKKGKGSGGSSTLPTVKDGPDKCPQAAAAFDSSVCWWNGNAWVCGTEA